MALSRRGFLGAALAALVAPPIVRAASLMPGSTVPFRLPPCVERYEMGWTDKRWLDAPGPNVQEFKYTRTALKITVTSDIDLEGARRVESLINYMADRDPAVQKLIQDHKDDIERRACELIDGRPSRLTDSRAWWFRDGPPPGGVLARKGPFL